MNFDEWRDCVGGKERAVMSMVLSNQDKSDVFGKYVPLYLGKCITLFGKYVLLHLGNMYKYIWEICITLFKIYVQLYLGNVYNYI